MNSKKYSILKTLVALTATAMMLSCAEEADNGITDITSMFNDKWNINEDVVHNDDGTITYDALMWGGMVAYFDNDGLPQDWTGYDRLVFEFAERTEVNSQLMINDDIVASGNVGITSLECSFLGLDVTQVKQVALQAAEPAVFKVKRIYLTTKGEEQPPVSITIWEGRCAFGNWENGFVVNGDKFKTAVPGDILEIVYTTDDSTPEANAWQIKTIYSSTDHTLEGNANELNKWGSVNVSRSSTIHHIALTANDVDSLKKYGLFANGHYAVVKRCNLLQW